MLSKRPTGLYNQLFTFFAFFCFNNQQFMTIMRKKATLSAGLLPAFLCFVFCIAGMPQGYTAELPPGHLKVPSAQVIQGKITDANTGNPLSAATIFVKGSTTSTASDEMGSYSITVADDAAILVISFVGYTTQEVAVKGKTTVNVLL